MKNKKKILLGAVGIAAVSMLMVGCSNETNQDSGRQKVSHISFLENGNTKRQWILVYVNRGAISKDSEVREIINVDGKNAETINYTTLLRLKDFRNKSTKDVNKLAIKSATKRWNYERKGALEGLNDQLAYLEDGSGDGNKLEISKTIKNGVKSVGIDSYEKYEPVKSKINVTLKTDGSGNNVESEEITTKSMSFVNPTLDLSNDETYYNEKTGELGSTTYGLKQSLEEFSDSTGNKKISFPNSYYWKWVSGLLPDKSTLVLHDIISGDVYDKHYIGYKVGDDEALITVSPVKGNNVNAKFDSMNNKLVKVD